MKQFLFLLLAVLSTATAFAQANVHHRAKIYYDAADQLARLDRLGVAVDHGIHKLGYSVESDFSEAELAIVTAEGMNYDIVIKNIGQFYLDQNDPTSAHFVSGVELKNASCGDVGGETEYVTPTNYSAGSMGGFLNYDELLAEMDAMYAYSEANNLGIITQRADNINSGDVDDLKTFEGRYQQWMMISDGAEGASTGQPQVFYNALHHAREPASMQQLVFYMWYLLENYATNEEVKDIVDNTELYFMPCVNPDGFLHNATENPNGGGFWRKNRRDGHGVDNNRNYDYVTPEGNSIFNTTGVSESTEGQTYPGTEAFSEPENRGTRFFTETHNFTMTLNNHTFGSLLLYPFGYEVDKPTPDDIIFRAISAEMVSENGYSNILSAGLYPASGDSDDFGYGFLNTTDGGTREKVFAMTPEIGPAFWPAASQVEGICKDMMLHNLRAAQFMGPFGTVKDDSPVLVATTDFTFDYIFTRLGFVNGDITVTIEPVSVNIISVEGPKTYGSLAQGETANDDNLLQLDPAIRNGDLIVFNIQIDNGRRVMSQQVTKTYGISENLLTESIDNLDNWTTDTWGISNTVFHPSSPSTSITDSPDGDYENGRNDFIEFNEVIDLTGEDFIDANLDFFARWDIEGGYDWVQLQIAVEGSGDWVPQCGRFTKTGVQNQIAADGEPVYDGRQDEWVQESISLSDYLGQRIQVRLYILSDGGVTGDGFYFDQMEVNTISETPTSTDETALDGRLSIYPNPVSDQLTITTDLSDYDYALTDVLGRQLRQATNNRGNERINFAGLAKGVYLLTVSAQGAQKTTRVVKE